MGQDKRVGIFMRVYRNEPDMHRAVKSVLDQTYKNWKYYILVNEKTKAEMSRYAEQDSRIVIMDGQPVDGFSFHAKDIANDGNDYVTTIDADDYYVDCYLEELVGFAEENHIDVTAISYEFIDESGKFLGDRKLDKNVVWRVEQTNQVLKYVYGFFRTIWGKLFSAEVIRKYNQERLPNTDEYGGYGGDTLFTFNVLYEAEYVGIVAKVGYKYTISNKGGTHKLNAGRLQSDVLLFRFVKEFLEKKSIYDENAAKMLFAVYGNAVNDTVCLLYEVNLPENETILALQNIMEHDLTKLLLLRNEAKTLIEIEKTDFFKMLFTSLFMSNRCLITEETREGYYRIYQAVCYAQKRVLNKEEFMVLSANKRAIYDFQIGDRARLCSVLLDAMRNQNEYVVSLFLGIIRKANEVVVLDEVLKDSSFVLCYGELVKNNILAENSLFFESLAALFQKEELPYEAEKLICWWNNYAAYIENIEQYILSNEMKVEYLAMIGKMEEAVNVFEELLKLGVDDENMQYLEKMIKK